MAERSDFATFLRSRRERVTPAEAGLPAGGRRRTPGLRREELAMLAGISVDYLVRLEQGRESAPSAAVVRSLSDALGLNADERKHLWSLVARTTQSEMCPEAPVPGTAVPPVTQQLLDRLDGTPGFVLDPLSEVLAWNEAYDRLMRPTGLLDTVPVNLLRFTFLHPAARGLFRDWADVAREQVGNLRMYTVGCTDECPAAISLVGELTTKSPDFVRFWADYEVGEKRQGLKRLLHPVAGELNLEFTALGLPEPSWSRLVTYLPADEASGVALDRLVADEPAALASPAHLRVV